MYIGIKLDDSNKGKIAFYSIKSTRQPRPMFHPSNIIGDDGMYVVQLTPNDRNGMLMLHSDRSDPVFASPVDTSNLLNR